jgi:hypothetical protein
MKKRIVSLALGVLAIPTLGSVAYAAAHSVSDRPAAQVIIPASSSSSLRAAGADDPATHDLGDDRGGTTIPGTTGTTVVGHDVGDDHGGTTIPGTTGTTVAGHDVGDDHGGASNSGSSGRGSGTSGSGGRSSSGSGDGHGSDG